MRQHDHASNSRAWLRAHWCSCGRCQSGKLPGRQCWVCRAPAARGRAGRIRRGCTVLGPQRVCCGPQVQAMRGPVVLFPVQIHVLLHRAVVSTGPCWSTAGGREAFRVYLAAVAPQLLGRAPCVHLHAPCCQGLCVCCSRPVCFRSTAADRSVPVWTGCHGCLASQRTGCHSSACTLLSSPGLQPRAGPSRFAAWLSGAELAHDRPAHGHLSLLRLCFAPASKCCLLQQELCTNSDSVITWQGPPAGLLGLRTK